MSTKMKAVICEKYGSPDVLKISEVDKPVPKDNEVLIKIIASAVNSGDVRTRALAVDGFLLRNVMRLVLGFNKPRQPILGTVLSGIVEEVGQKVENFKPGDKVYATTGLKFGCYAEYICLSENTPISLMPANSSFEDAAAIPFGGCTAIYFLRKAKIEERQNIKILIYGASGAVGTSALQLAKYYGAEVTAVCSNENSDLVKSLGADHIIDYTKEDFTSNGEKYDIVFDAVGKKLKKDCINSLTETGIFVTTGAMDVADEKKEYLQFLADLYDKGLYKSVIDKVYNLDQIVEAHRYVDTGKKRGNVVIKVQ